MQLQTASRPEFVGSVPFLNSAASVQYRDKPDLGQFFFNIDDVTAIFHRIFVAVYGV